MILSEGTYVCWSTRPQPPERIPFQVINPSALIAMQEHLSALGYDVDEITLGEALGRYFKAVES